MDLDPSLLDILACPACHATLAANNETETLDCTGCGRRYPVRDNIPVLLVDEAETPA